MGKTIFLYSGEGTHDGDTRFRLLSHSPRWDQIREILHEKLGIDLEILWEAEIGNHRCPSSPLFTVVSQICLSDLWRQWGYAPDMVVGHSTGELAAVHEAGFYTLEEILLLAHGIGTVAARLDGTMMHGWLTDDQIDKLPVHLSSFNFSGDAGRHVTVCGFAEEMEAFYKRHPEFVSMRLPHPWHHPHYEQFSDRLARFGEKSVDGIRFVSGVTTRAETRLPDDHWHRWLIQPIDFIQTMETVKRTFADDHLDIIEIGFHPVLEKCCEIFDDYTNVSSMFRQEDDIQWILHQRRKLSPAPFLDRLGPVIEKYRPGLDYGVSLAYQDFNSLKFTELAAFLEPFFPGLAPQDFYRHKTIDQLIDGFGTTSTIGPFPGGNGRRNEVVIAAMSCRMPVSVETLPQFWEMLMGAADQVGHPDGRGGVEAGFLSDAVTRFDHRYFNISQAEARTMDPQQILALELTEMLFRDAGIDPETLDRTRVGVYMGAWNQEYGGDPTSVYYPSGTNPSIIASRISYHYDLRGPSWVSNTACSSSLVAVHYAAKDIEAGRVDYAIAGGVNMVLDKNFTTAMANAGFLSKDYRCKAFDDSANGYVRAEGGGLVLLVNRSFVDRYYAKLVGSAINQNGGRSQVITAPHPQAQEELILLACQDAGLTPETIDFVESHGTGTKIGDPIEMSAVQNTLARNRKFPLYVGSVKSNIGHLESAAGIAGLIKAVAAVNIGTIPPNLHFTKPNDHIDFVSYPIQVVTRPTPIGHEAHGGVSSFGFGGANAHVIIQGAADAERKPIQPVEVPFRRDPADRLAPYHRGEKQALADPMDPPAVASAGPSVRTLIQELMTNVIGVGTIDPQMELMEQGLDSMSATEVIRTLEETYGIDIDPDLLFEFPLIDQFVRVVEARITEKSGNGRGPVTREAVDRLVGDLFYQLTQIDTIDPQIELTEQGLDSMSATAFVSELEKALNIELEPEMIFEFPFRDQFVDEVFAQSGAGLN